MPTDYDIHGIVGVRLLDPGEADVRAVSNAIGPPVGALERAPDVVVRYVGALERRGPLRRLGAGGAAFTDDAFLVVRHARGRETAAQLPLEQIGATPCELLCERSFPGVPVLGPIVNLVALAKGWVPVHASAFDVQGVGVLVAGWAGGGKTGALLAFMAAGATYIGDDWVFLGGDGVQMRGLPAPLEVKTDYLDQLPDYRARLASRRGTRERMRAGAVRGARRAVRRSRGRHADRLESTLERRSRVRVRPEVLFGAQACPLAGTLDRAIIALTHDAPDVQVSPMPSSDLARRLDFVLEHEWDAMDALYTQFRFAFPDAENPVLEGRRPRQSDALRRALTDTPAHLVSHPSPAPIAELRDALSAVLAA